MKTIEKQLREDLEYFGVTDASPESDEYEIGLEEDCSLEETIIKFLEQLNNQTPV